MPEGTSDDDAFRRASGRTFEDAAIRPRSLTREARRADAATATLLYLGASVSQLPAIRAGLDDGHRVVAVDGDPHALGLGIASVGEAFDFSDVDRLVEVARRHHVDGVVAVCTDRAVAPAAAAAARLGLPGIGVETARAMTDKLVMRSRLAEAGIAQPEYVALDEDVDPAAALAAVGVPAVVKPADSGGQRGLFRVESVAELEASLPSARAVSRSRRALLERFVEGNELNVIAVVRDGRPSVISVSDRLRPGGIGFGVGWIHLYPSCLPPSIVARVRAVATDAIQALGLRDGIAFPQLLVDADREVRVVEVAARIAAGQMADVVRLGAGIDLVRIALRQALGRPVPDELAEPRFRRPLAVRFFTAQPGPLPTGRVIACEGLEDVRAARGVLEADLYIEPGETIRPVQVDADRRGYVIATAANPVAALARADEAAARLVVTTEPAERGSRKGYEGAGEPSSPAAAGRRPGASSRSTAPRRRDR